MPVSRLDCRLLIDSEPYPGSWNMAVDAMLLDRAAVEAACVVRVYRWSEPTLSLGHFQKADEVPTDRFGSLAQVRRLSGGGAILHDRELTYSITLPRGHPFCADPRSLYGPVHETIIDVVRGWGAELSLRGEPNRSAEESKPRSDRDGAFLCFRRGDAQDLVLGEHKILGSAQRRRRGAVLQHGSLLLTASEYAPEFPGLTDLADVTVPSLAAHQIGEAIAGLIASDHERDGLSPSEQLRAEDLEPSMRINGHG